MQGDNLGNVDHRILGKHSTPLRQEHVTGDSLDAQIGGQDGTNDRIDPALVEIVALNDEYGAAIAGAQNPSAGEVRPTRYPRVASPSLPGKWMWLVHSSSPDQRIRLQTHTLRLTFL